MKKFIFFLIILLTCVSCKKEITITKCCECLEAQGISDKYIFPIRPGMEEWAELESHKAMVDVCQIPESILNDMCTIGLVDTYYDYPLLFIIFAFNNINDGLQQISDEFNGFHELLLRDDCATKLLRKYELISPADLDSTWTTLERGHFKQKLQFMELTLAFEPVNEKFTPDEREKVIRLGLYKLKLKEAYDYSGPSQITNIYLIARALEKEEYEPFLGYIERREDLKYFINGYLMFLNYVADGDTIKSYGVSYLNNN